MKTQKQSGKLEQGKGIMPKGKKGQVLDQLSSLVLTLTFLAILLGVAFLIVANIASNADVVADSNASRAIDLTQEAMSSVPNWLGIVVIVVIGSVILGLIQFFRR